MAAPPSLLGQPKAVWRQPPLSGVLTPVRADGLGARSIDCGARALATGREGRSTPAAAGPAPVCAGSGRVAGASEGSRRRVLAARKRSALRQPDIKPRVAPSRGALEGRRGGIRGGVTHTRQCFACYGSSNGHLALPFGRARRRAALHRGNTSSLPRAKKTRPASTRRRGKDPIRPAEAS